MKAKIQILEYFEERGGGTIEFPVNSCPTEVTTVLFVLFMKTETGASDILSHVSDRRNLPSYECLKKEFQNRNMKRLDLN
jgi:hypothetical protein